MKLLDIMLKHEIKWPAEAQCAVQDDDGILKWVFSNSLPELWDSGVWCRGNLSGSDPVFGFINLADDWYIHIITHAEYQAAGGWMKWEGGECPVDGKTMVDTKWDCDTSFECLAEKTTWMHEPDGANIIAYRITNQRPVQLDNPEIEPDFEPFVSVEDAQEHIVDHTKYLEIPNGWQLVPVEPTAEMLRAATHDSVCFGTKAVYQAMLAAAPKPKDE